MGPQQRLPGLRPWADQRRGARGLREGALTGSLITLHEHSQVIREISSRSAVVRILSTEAAHDRSHSCAGIRADLAVGLDPTARWREMVACSTRARYAGHLPTAMPGAFVAQWYCDIVALPAALSAVLTEYVLDISPRCVSFDIDPVAGYPTVVGLRPGDLRRVTDPRARVELAHERYLAHVGPFVQRYEAGVKAGSRQRFGMARDMWLRALETALSAQERRPPVPVARESCCFIYALPGCHACAGCPRGR